MPKQNIQPTDKKVTVRTYEGLTAKQRLFCECLLANGDFNATQAAKDAGYKKPGVAGAKNLQDSRIRRVIGNALRERIERCQLTADAVLEHLRQALFLDPLDVFEMSPEGAYTVRSLEDIPQEVRRCITKIKQRNRMVGDSVESYVEVEFMSKDSAMVNALKHLGLVQPDGNNNLTLQPDFLTHLLQQVEEERRGKIIDAKVVEKLVED